MGISLSRFYQKERIELDCEIVTPMFLGNAEQEAELRGAPFKALLRYWWRVAAGRDKTSEQLFAAESKIFGDAGDELGKGQVSIAVFPATNDSLRSSKDNFSKSKIRHPEVKGGQTDALGYLAGMGLMHYKKGILHSYFPAGQKFKLVVDVSEEGRRQLKKSMSFLAKFGAIGSRSRNGWGCFQTVFAGNSKNLFDTIPFENAFSKDYPNTLGHDNKGLLLWQTGQAATSWERCMRDLAEIYVQTRTFFRFTGGQPHPAQQDRHLLGYPVTNHSVGKWGKQGRHASALRLLVRKQSDGYRGFILHLPHLFSKTMWPGDVERQKKIWRDVHGRLDELMNRATLEEL